MIRIFLISIFFLFSSASLNARTLESFDMNNAPISTFIQWVSDETGNNIVLGRGVEGSITVHIKDLDSEDVMHLFERVISANGYALRTSNGIYVVVINKNLPVEQEPLTSKVYKFNNLKDTEVVDAVINFLSTYATSVSSQHTMISKHSVIQLSASNSLLVSASMEQIAYLDKFMSAIDSSVPQVLVEGIVVETDLIDSKQFGVNFSTSLSNNGLTFIQNAVSASTSVSALGLGGHAVLSQGGDFRGLISSLISNSNVKIVSKPYILVRDRELGQFLRGQDVPFLVSNEVTDGGKLIQNIERHNVGEILTVTPHVIGSNRVILDIHQESSSVADATQAIGFITNKRSISTVAEVSNGQTLLLGGLVREEERTVETGVPLLKDIPFLGALFRSEQTVKTQKELTMMIRTTLL
jgi:general secretion pathway protein D